MQKRVTLREASPCPGEAKHDWQIICDLASARQVRYFSYTSAEDIFNELREASRGGIADYSGISYDRLRREGGIHSVSGI